MPKSGSIIGKITEELGELGKKVATETAKAPADIVGAVFEKNPSGSKSAQEANKSQKEQSIPKKEKTPLDELEGVKTEKERQTFARRVLEYMSGKRKREPSVHEEHLREEGEKKERQKQQAKAAAWQQLPNTGHAARRGDPRNIAAKQANPEAGKNMRQE